MHAFVTDTSAIAASEHAQGVFLPRVLQYIRSWMVAIFHFEVAALLRDEYFAAACDLKIEEEEGKLFRRNLLIFSFIFIFLVEYT